MFEKIVQLNEAVIKSELKELVRGSVEETLNELMEAEADKLSLRQPGMNATNSAKATATATLQLQPHHYFQRCYPASAQTQGNFF